MKLTVFNGSPRGKQSNTKIVLDEFISGFESTSGNTHELAYLKQTNEHGTFAETYGKAEAVLLAFPLYVDAMPGIVKAFIEELAPFAEDKNTAGPTVLFLVQSGFPEASHSRRVERYLEKLSRRLGCEYAGTMVKGGIEGIKAKPPWMVKGAKQDYRYLGEHFGKTGTLDPALLKKLAKPETLSAGMKLLLNILGKFGVTDMYWNMKLKEHNAFEKRFAKPYATQECP